MVEHHLIMETVGGAVVVSELWHDDPAALRLLERVHERAKAAAAQAGLETQHLPLEQALTHVHNLTTSRH